MERTCIIIKPDGLQRNLIGQIIRYYEKAGLKVVAMKLMKADAKLLEDHYPMDKEYMISLGKKSEKAGDKVENYEEWGRMIINGLREYLMSGAVVAMVLEGENAVKKARDISGYTDPAHARRGTLRGDFKDDTILQANKDKRAVRNLLHASGTLEEAKKEIELWFKKAEIHS